MIHHESSLMMFTQQQFWSAIMAVPWYQSEFLCSASRNLLDRISMEAWHLNSLQSQ